MVKYSTCSMRWAINQYLPRSMISRSCVFLSFGIYLRCLTSQSVGLDKAKLEIYALVDGIYYDLLVNYATQLWEEFVKNIGNTNAVNGISYARYWSLILQYAYEKEGIVVSNDEQTTEFSLYHFPKNVKDDQDLFPTVKRISDGMIR